MKKLQLKQTILGRIKTTMAVEYVGRPTVQCFILQTQFNANYLATPWSDFNDIDISFSNKLILKNQIRFDYTNHPRRHCILANRTICGAYIRRLLL